MHAGTVRTVLRGSGQVWDERKHLTGIAKQAAEHLDVRDPGPREDGGRSGVAGDFVGDLKHHGGTDKAVYLFPAEELAWWSAELGRDLPDGAFGENITTVGLDLDASLVGTRWRIGTATLEVSLPRIPCRTFAWAMDEPGWMKRFTDHGRAGVYTRVVEPGRIAAGDAIVEVFRPDHDVRMLDVFAARTRRDRSLLARVVEARVLPPAYHEEYAALLG